MPSGLSILVLERYESPVPASLRKHAMVSGYELTEEEADGESVAFTFDGGFVVIMPIDAPHPDLDSVPYGPLSADLDELQAAGAHCIIAVNVTDESSASDRNYVDVFTAAITASVVRTLESVVGVCQHPGLVFRKPEVYLAVADQAVDNGTVPLLLGADVTVARESATTMSFLTHNMDRYGCDDLYVVAPVDGRDAFEFTLDIAAWLMDSGVSPQPGETVGRTADEKILVERKPNPVNATEEVIKLTLG